MKKRPKPRQINAQMDTIGQQKPSEKLIEETVGDIRKSNEDCINYNLDLGSKLE